MSAQPVVPVQPAPPASLDGVVLPKNLLDLGSEICGIIFGFLVDRKDQQSFLVCSKKSFTVLMPTIRANFGEQKNKIFVFFDKIFRMEMDDYFQRFVKIEAAVKSDLVDLSRDFETKQKKTEAEEGNQQLIELSEKLKQEEFFNIRHWDVPRDEKSDLIKSLQTGLLTRESVVYRKDFRFFAEQKHRFLKGVQVKNFSVKEPSKEVPMDEVKALCSAHKEVLGKRKEFFNDLDHFLKEFAEKCSLSQAEFFGNLICSFRCGEIKKELPVCDFYEKLRTLSSDGRSLMRIVLNGHNRSLAFEFIRKVIQESLDQQGRFVVAEKKLFVLLMVFQLLQNSLPVFRVPFNEAQYDEISRWIAKLPLSNDMRVFMNDAVGYNRRFTQSNAESFDRNFSNLELRLYFGFLKELAERQYTPEELLSISPQVQEIMKILKDFQEGYKISQLHKISVDLFKLGAIKEAKEFALFAFKKLETCIPFPYYSEGAPAVFRHINSLYGETYYPPDSWSDILRKQRPAERLKDIDLLNELCNAFEMREELIKLRWFKFWMDQAMVELRNS